MERREESKEREEVLEVFKERTEEVGWSEMRGPMQVLAISPLVMYNYMNTYTVV